MCETVYQMSAIICGIKGFLPSLTIFRSNCRNVDALFQNFFLKALQRDSTFFNFLSFSLSYILYSIIFFFYCLFLLFACTTSCPDIHAVCGSRHSLVASHGLSLCVSRCTSPLEKPDLIQALRCMPVAGKRGLILVRSACQSPRN